MDEETRQLLIEARARTNHVSSERSGQSIPDNNTDFDQHSLNSCQSYQSNDYDGTNGVPLLDKVYQLHAEPLTSTLVGCALLQFVDQELEQINEDDENIYYVNPAAIYQPPTGQATQERAKLRVARAKLEEQHKNANLQNRKKKTLTVNERQKLAFDKNITARYRSIMTTNGNGNGGLANALIKGIESAKGGGGSSDIRREFRRQHKGHHDGPHPTAHQRHSNGMVPMDYQTTETHGFYVSNNHKKPLVSFETNETSTRTAGDAGHRPGSSPRQPCRPRRTADTNRVAVALPCDAGVVADPDAATASVAGTSPETLLGKSSNNKSTITMDSATAATRTSIFDVPSNGLQKRTFLTKKKKYRNHENFVKARIPSRPTRKKKLTRENVRLMREIEVHLEEKDASNVGFQIDLSKYDFLRSGTFVENIFQQNKNNAKRSIVPLPARNSSTRSNSYGSNKSWGNEERDQKRNEFVSLNVNRALAATEATTRIDQRRSAVASRFYGEESHTSSYPSVFKRSFKQHQQGDQEVQ